MGAALSRVRLPSWDAFAWGAIALTVAFIALTYWWLTQDHGVPGTEPGAALNAALVERDMLHAGDLLGPLNYEAIHPPLLQIVGAVAMLIGGIDVAAPVFGENLVFVPLLALGCYQTAKLLGGARAGLLAVVFALGAPLMVEQFHVYMVDAADAGLVATAVWLILASRRFTRLGVATAAGAVVGLGLETKQQFPIFIVGLLAVVLWRGQGWRNWRGIALFAAAAFVVGSPWYLVHLSEVSELTGASVTAATPGTLPPRLSLTNLEWYLWGALNGLLFLPLFTIAAIGFVKTTVELVRRRTRGEPSEAAQTTTAPPAANDVTPELLAGALVSWIALMATPIHVVRYMLPMMVYIAVLGTVWIVKLHGTWRRIATAALVLATVASTLGATFGAGHPVGVKLTSTHIPDRSVYGIRRADQVVLYSPRDFLVGGPKRSGDVLGLMKALRRHGTLAVTWLPETEEPYVFDHYGVDSLAAMARLAVLGSFNPAALAPHVALLVRQSALGSAPPCIRLSDGTGIWVRFGRASAPETPNYCPFRRPAFYAPG